jgi:NhaP-type Na+/H+ or K+/H+ antiporter
MAAELNPLEEVVRTRVMRLNATITGVVLGIIVGFAIFIATNWLLIKAEEGEVVGPHLSLLGQFFIGYDVSFGGSLIGLAYGFITAFIIGYSLATIYNWTVDFRQHKRIS